MFDFRFKGYCFPSCLEWTGTEPEDGVMKSDETGINLHKHLSDIGLLSFFTHEIIHGACRQKIPSVTLIPEK